MTKKIGKGMYEWAAKVDEYARGMVGPTGSTLFEELGLYYIGPVDGHNIEDLVCVLREVASLDSMGPVLVHVITEEKRDAETGSIIVKGISPSLLILVSGQCMLIQILTLLTFVFQIDELTVIALLRLW